MSFATIIGKVIELWGNHLSAQSMLLLLLMLWGGSTLQAKTEKAQIGYAYAIVLDGFGISRYGESPQAIVYSWHQLGDKLHMIPLQYICRVNPDYLKRRFNDDQIHGVCGIAG